MSVCLISGAALLLGVAYNREYGLLGFSVHPVSWRRVAGAALMPAGLALVCVF